MKIETKHADLSTLAVTIQALHVSGKQMTLAVFRQLPRRAEMANADLWGIVRYAIKEEGEAWLVFSEDGCLYRRPVVIREDPWFKRHVKIAGNEVTRTVLQRDKNLEAQEALETAKQQLAAHLNCIEYDKNLLSQLPQLFIAV